MILQKIIFPEINSVGKELYFRTEENSLIFKKGSVCSFNTYFNGFSLEKWKKYTKINNLGLLLNVQGEFECILSSMYLDENRDVVSDFLQKNTINDNNRIININNLDYKGILFFELRAMEDGASFIGGEFFTQVDEADTNEVEIALNICTYKREEFIERNIKLLKSSILENRESQMKEHLEIFISDNGNSLDMEKFDSKKVNIFSNRNLGGSGGFTRNLIEIMNKKDVVKNKTTHVLFMDDDVKILPESLERVYSVLRLIKDEYRDAFIGGAMLSHDRMNFQIESGALLYDKGLVSCKRGYDLTEEESILKNEIEESVNYNGWWFCCMPLNLISTDNLPIPFFIRGDDMEYCLRNMKDLILMNGICVWHETFEKKYTPVIEYYIARNEMITRSIHFEGFSKKKVIMDIIKKVYRELIRYKYETIYFYLLGVREFLLGSKWLMELDSESKHMELSGRRIKKTEPEFSKQELHSMLEAGRFKGRENAFHKLLRVVTFNGGILPAKSDRTISMSDGKSVDSYRAKTIAHYDDDSGNYYTTKKSVKQSFLVTGNTIKTLIKIIVSFNKIKSDYRNNISELQSYDFWIKYLSLEKGE